MKKFKFSLHTILNLAISEEKKIMLEIGQLNLKKQKKIYQINEYNIELSKVFELPFKESNVIEGKVLSLMPPVFKGVRIKIENIKK